MLVLPLLAAPSAKAERAEAGVNARLVDYYAKRANYRRVKRDVLRWHRTTRNGCVAFASTALRHIGFEIPERGKRDGYGVSRITFAFSGYLEESGWARINTTQHLRPGDMVFTTGYPDHVFVFYFWSDEENQVAKVIDNQGFLVKREMFPRLGSANAAFAYALRSPEGGRDQ